MSFKRQTRAGNIMKGLSTVFISLWQLSFVSSVSITVPGDVVAGRPFTLECKITRPRGDLNRMRWEYVAANTALIYLSRFCNASIPVSQISPAGLSGGCQRVNGEEVYTVTIENVTEDTGRGRWLCQYGGEIDSVTLDVKVMVTRVTLTNTPGAVLAGDPSTFTCVTTASKPQACIRGYIRRSGNVRELGPPADCNQDSSLVQTTTRTLTFTASAEDNGAELYCNASNSVTDPPVRSQVYTLNVQYAPEITCNSTHVTVFEGQKLKVSCDVTSKDNVVIHWSKCGRRIDNALSTNLRGPARSEVTISTVEFESAEARLSGVYQIKANNIVGSSTREITITVIDGQFIPQELGLTSCTDNHVSLIWASGLDDSLVEYYKLEYKGTDELWKRELVKNPGRVKLVRKTLIDLQPGVFYQFRLQPNSDIVLSEYATTNCTTEDSQLFQGPRDVPEAGLSKGGMLGVGVVIGAAVVTVIGVSVTCWLRRKTPSSGPTELAWEKQDTSQVMSTAEYREIEGRIAEDTAEPESSAHGHYEDLDTAPNPGPHYEQLSRRATSSTTGDHRVYENATV